MNKVAQHVTHILILMSAGPDLHLKFYLNGVAFNCPNVFSCFSVVISLLM